MHPAASALKSFDMITLTMDLRLLKHQFYIGSPKVIGPSAYSLVKMKKTLCLIIFLTVGFFANVSMAQDPLCDVALFDQMAERARWQGQRETVAVENLVYKPDSVMEYTCFTRFVDHIPPNIRYASAGFFEDANGDDIPDYIVTYDFSTDPMNDLSINPAQNWMWSNFGHTYLGGRASPGTATVAGGTNYLCNAMDAVWELAKCQQFAPEEPEDGFYTLTDFLSAGILRYPQQCTTPPTVAFGKVPADPIEVVYTSSGGNPADCGVPVPTGQVITMQLDQNDPPGRPVTYNEKICPNITCTYVPTALNAGNCVP